MKLATLRDGTADGRLIIVSPLSDRFLLPDVQTLQQAVERWAEMCAHLESLTKILAEGGGDPLDPTLLTAPLPRAWQWLDGSAFETHGALMQRAFNMPSIETKLPLMYQGMSHQFLGPRDDVPFPSEADGIDFEGEFGIVTDAVPMGTSADDALDHIKLIVQINDWSLRAIAPIEMKTGFGWIQAKPACSVAAVAVTPDELGEAWRDGRVCLPLRVELNGQPFGHPNGAAMAFGFHDLIAHAARSRSLPAGTIIGSGTVSNADYESVGSTCLSERRGIEIIASGAPITPFMRFGDTIQMEARTLDDAPLFGEIAQKVIRHEGLFPAARHRA